MEIKRDKYLRMLQARRNNGMVKVITGIRRCGKSYLMNTLFYEYLREEGMEEEHIIRFAFDSADDLSLIGENLQELVKNRKKVDPQKFMGYLSTRVIDDKPYCLLLDEVQNLDCFEAVLNGYLRKRNLDIYVTGSNSKFLSTDVLTEFAGRGDEVRVYPLTFSEYYSCHEEDGFDYALDDYMTYGGLPALLGMITEEQKMSYLKTQLNNVYLKDLVERYGLQNEDNLGELLDVIASGISSLTNPSKLSNTFKTMKKANLSEATISRYIQYMEEAFLLSSAIRYDVKGKKYIKTPFKLYFEDLGLRNARLDFRQVEETHLMENLIYNELRYRGFQVDVGLINDRVSLDGMRSRKQFEVDFVANCGSRRYYIQSVYEIPDEAKMEQETIAFDRIGDSFKKVIVIGKTMRPKRTEKGYLLLGIRDFLLNPDSLDL